VLKRSPNSIRASSLATSCVVITVLIPSLSLALSLLSACSGGAQQGLSQEARAPRLNYRVVASYPHDERLFTQGLALSPSGELIESAGGYGESSLSLRSLGSATPRLRQELPVELFGEGVTAMGELVIQLTWKERVARVYTLNELRLLGELSYGSEGWGLAYGPGGLVYSDGSSELRWVEHEGLTRLSEGAALEGAELTGALKVSRTISVRERGRLVPRLNELEWLGGLLVANVWRSDELVIIDPNEGEVIARVDLSGLLPSAAHPEGFDPINDVLNGVAWLPLSPTQPLPHDDLISLSRAGRLLVTGKRWPLIYELELDVSGEAEGEP